MYSKLLLFGILVHFTVLSAQMQTIGTYGTVNWEKQTIISKGIGATNPNAPNIAAQRAGAIRVAKLDALRNALETVKGIAINSETTVRNYMVENDVIRSNVEGFVQGFSIPENGIHYMSDGSVEVEVEIPLSGLYRGAPGLFFGGKPSGRICPTCGQPWPHNLPYPETVNEVNKKSKKGKGKVYTGLVIDARGLGLMPAMSPRVLDEKGKEVYGSAYIKKEFAIKQGMVGYVKDIKKAAKLDRVTDNPGIVKALRALGKNKTDVVISNKDSADILNAKKNLSFMEKCRVVFVVD